MTHISTSSEQTKQIASDFAKTLKGGEVVLLEGDLGAGKTTFVQGVAEEFGVTDPVRSPTFTIMNIYKTDRDDIKEVIHIDLYRLQKERDIDALGLEEWIGRKDLVIFIEWPDYIAIESGIDYYKINMLRVKDGDHKVEIKKLS